jgi:IS605 OrfB family transposase
VLPKDHVYAEGEKRRLTVREENFCGGGQKTLGHLNKLDATPTRKGILNWRDNLKDYFIKKLFSQLAHRCHELGIGIVAMENLEMLGSYKNKKEQNRMFNMWPRGQMKKFAEDAFEYMGIIIQYVDENGTSQHDADTGIRGYRDGNNFWLPNGTKKHADKNASKMIALRGLTHHTNLFKRRLVNIGGGYYVNAYELIKATKDQTNAATRLRGAETRLNGYSATVYQTSGDGVVVVPKLNATTIIGGKDISMTKENTESYYKMDKTNTWYPWSVVKDAENEMKKNYTTNVR